MTHSKIHRNGSCKKFNNSLALVLSLSIKNIAVSLKLGLLDRFNIIIQVWNAIVYDLAMNNHRTSIIFFSHIKIILILKYIVMGVVKNLSDSLALILSLSLKNIVISLKFGPLDRFKIIL